ncbi:hypothetical protein L7F22_018088 [Adiantum nelumboides]|nr:hypothetical protein [Adiantum nelumboides]MCO5564427.1 hypothetical protein [Adiantum nelumboides]
MPFTKPNCPPVAYSKDDLARGHSQGLVAQPVKLMMDPSEDKLLSHQEAPPPTFAEVANNAPSPPFLVLFRGNIDENTEVNLGQAEAPSPGAQSVSSKRTYNPSESEDSAEHQPPCVVIDNAALKNWYTQLQKRVVIGLCHGVRPSAEALKNWINIHWGSKNIKPSHVQYLPNNYYLFFFDNPVEALQVVGYGQWLIRNTPISVFKWYERFNPRGDKPTKVPFWVDFPNLPMDFLPWLKDLGSYLGTVLGQKSRGALILNGTHSFWLKLTSIKLIYEIPIKDSDGSWLHSQMVTYENLPNACFYCHKMVHHIKNIPELTTKDPIPETKEDTHQGFQQVSRRNSMKQPKNNKTYIPKGNSFKVLLEDVFDPLNHIGTFELDLSKGI